MLQASGLGGCVEILEGLSTEVELPEPVDVVIAEVIGSVASEEGAMATLRDARRFLREPDRADSWIPLGAKTLCAPVLYDGHGALAAEQCEVPVRCCAADPEVHRLAPPQLIESFSFDRLASLVDVWAQELEFEVEGPAILSGFALFVRVEFTATPAIEFEDWTTWQQIVCLMAPRPVPLDAMWQVLRVRARGELSPLPARYSLSADFAWSTDFV